MMADRMYNIEIGLKEEIERKIKQKTEHKKKENKSALESE